MKSFNFCKSFIHVCIHICLYREIYTHVHIAYIFLSVPTSITLKLPKCRFIFPFVLLLRLPASEFVSSVSPASPDLTWDTRSSALEPSYAHEQSCQRRQRLLLPAQQIPDVVALAIWTQNAIPSLSLIVSSNSSSQSLSLKHSSSYIFGKGKEVIWEELHA